MHLPLMAGAFKSYCFKKEKVMFKIFHKLNAWVIVLIMITTGLILTSCNKEETDPSNQIVLHSYGPSPALRGGELKFIGLNLDKVTSIVLPDNINITDFKTKSANLIVIQVPESTIEGKVVLKTPQGDITAKTLLGISEPISIESFSPATVRPGDKLTIEGTYLNLIEEVIFSTRKSVTEFVSQSKDKIEVIVPEDAQSGIIVISNGAEEPILVESETALVVTLPAVSTVTPKPVKARTNLTLKGTDLDLVKKIIFPGGTIVDEFNLTEDKDIVVQVPLNSQDGKLKVVPASDVEVEASEEITMVVPTIASIPQTAKNGDIILITGTHLDLVTSVEFGGGVSGTIQAGRTATEMSVQVPGNAVDGVVKLHTAANKSVSPASALTLVSPAITSVTPTSLKTSEDITISGENLDLIAKVIFPGDKEVNVSGATSGQLVVTVPPGAHSGSVTLITTNGLQIVLPHNFNIEPGNAPKVTSMPQAIGTSTMLTIEGENLDLATEVIFPGNIKATKFGKKTATLLEVFVPENTTSGVGKITFKTSGGDISYSPDIEFLGAIKYHIYQDGLASGWQQWNGWDLTSQDWANTEQVYKGSYSIKVVYSGGYGAIQAHPTSGAVFNLQDYSELVLSVYGTIASRVAIQIKDGNGTEHADYAFDVIPGQWTKIEIPISGLGNIQGGINEFRIKNYGTSPNTIYIDEIGFR